MSAVAAKDRDYMSKALADTGEEIEWINWCSQNRGKKSGDLSTRLVAVGKHSLIIAKDGAFGRSITCNQKLMNLKVLTLNIEGGSARLHMEFGGASPERVELERLGAKEAPILADTIMLHYASATVGWPADRIVVNGMQRIDPDPASVPFGGLDACYESMCIVMGRVPHPHFSAEAASPDEMAGVFNLSNVKNVETMDLAPLATALKYNKWCREFIACDIRRPDLLEILAVVFGRNTTIAKVVLNNVEAVTGFGKFNEAVAGNEQITHLDISGNTMKDKGMSQFAPNVARLPNLTHLNVSDNAVGPRGLAALFDGLMKSPSPACLTFLDVSGNKLARNGTNSLSNFLFSANASEMRELHVSNANVSVTTLGEAVAHQGLPLTSVDISYSTVSTSDADALIVGLACGGVTELDVSFCRIQTPDLIHLVKEMGNPDTPRREMKVYLNGNDISHPEAQKRMFSWLAPNLTSLSLSDCNLDCHGMNRVIATLNNCPQLEHLALCRNIPGKSKEKGGVCLTMSAYLASASLKSLTLEGNDKCYLGEAIAPLLEGVGLSPTMTELNVSGNKYRDVGAEAMAECLIASRSLQAISIDYNNMSLSGLVALCEGIKSSSSLTVLELPVADVRSIQSSIKKKERAVFSRALEEIQTALKRNNGGDAGPAVAVGAAPRARAGSNFGIMKPGTVGTLRRKKKVMAAVTEEDDDEEPGPASPSGGGGGGGSFLAANIAKNQQERTVIGRNGGGGALNLDDIDDLTKPLPDYTPPVVAEVVSGASVQGLDDTPTSTGRVLVNGADRGAVVMGRAVVTA